MVAGSQASKCGFKYVIYTSRRQVWIGSLQGACRLGGLSTSDRWLAFPVISLPQLGSDHQRQ